MKENSPDVKKETDSFPFALQKVDINFHHLSDFVKDKLFKIVHLISTKIYILQRLN